VIESACARADGGPEPFWNFSAASPDYSSTVDNLRPLHTHTSFRYQASSWTHPRKVVARLECSLRPDSGETTTNGMRQESPKKVPSAAY
jgi:hypothetical protein